ncbi:MAG: 30S ribosomal protein S20 [Gammaproteobacteria bacterium]
MANTNQARKRVRQANKRRAHNASMRSMMRTYLKKTLAAIESGDQKQATEVFKTTSSALDKLSNKGIIHKNKAARHKHRLSQRIRQMAG